MEQFEQLLTCAICLDRYRNPKLLPCQHSFCMEPCMDGLVDYVRRQVKCPECRAEHRIPYQGVQAFPTNVTLQRFLELHIEITGELPDPTSGQTMERCGVCSEKSYCSLCVHCEKKCCPECKDAHMDILRREITRINSQVRRGLHRLQDALALVEKNTLGLQTNCASVAEEVDEIYRRLSKALKDRTEHLRNEVDRYLGTELRGLIQLKENLELEIANIQSNCDLAEAHINENVPWDDSELLDTKELFLRTVEFIRNFEYEAGDYSRRVRFVMAHDPNQLVLHVAGYGELNIKPETGSGGLLGSSSSSLVPPGGSPGLMRSKSDHRLASQYRQQEEERLARNRYVPEYEYDAPEYEVPRNKSRYRSRFMRHRDGDDSDGDSRSTVRFTSSAPQELSSLRERVLDTEDAARGPLSGIFRLTDSPRVMKKLQECERAVKRKKEEPASQPVQQQQQQPQPAKPQVQVRKVPSAMARQTSEDDEISRIKKQNKSATVTHTETVEERQLTTPAPVHPSPRELSEREPDEPIRRPAIARRTSAEIHAPPATRSASSDSSTGSESSAGSGIRNTGAPFTAEEMKQKYLSRAPSTNTTTTVSSGSAVIPTTGRESSNTVAPTPRPFQSRFLGAGNRAAPPPPIQTTREEAASKKKQEVEEDDEETSSSSEETESDTEEESETDVHPPNSGTSTANPADRRERSESAMARTDIGPLLARSAEARRGSKEDSPSTRYSSSRGSPAQSVTSPTSTTTTTTTMTTPGGTAIAPSGYTSRTFNDVTDERLAGRVGEDDREIAATDADYIFNVDDEDALRQIKPQTNPTSFQTDVIRDTDKSTTSSSPRLMNSSENLEGSCDSRIMSNEGEDDTLMESSRSFGNDGISLIIHNNCGPNESILVTDNETEKRSDMRFTTDDCDRDVAEEINIIVTEQLIPDLSNCSIETVNVNGDRLKSKSPQTISESSNSISGPTISDDSESESDVNFENRENDDDDDNKGKEDEEEEDESRDENCNLKMNKKEECDNGNLSDKDNRENKVNGMHKDSFEISGRNNETLNVEILNVSSNIQTVEDSLMQNDLYERELKRRSVSIINEKSIEEMFDDNGWVVTDQDLETDPQTDSQYSQTTGSMIPISCQFTNADPVDCPFEETEDSIDHSSDDAARIHADEIIPKILEQRYIGDDLRVRLDIKDVEKISTDEQDIFPTNPSRSHVYGQNSLGKNGWLISDESESESDRAVSPIEIVKLGINGDNERINSETDNAQHDSIIDENGWVILNDDDDDDNDDIIGKNFGKHRMSMLRSQTIDALNKSNIENGALSANATQSRDNNELSGEHEESDTDINIPMKMVTTVLCVSVLCYSVLMNLFP